MNNLDCRLMIRKMLGRLNSYMFLGMLSLMMGVSSMLGQDLEDLSDEIGIKDAGVESDPLDSVYAVWLMQGAVSALESGFSDLAIQLGEQAIQANVTAFGGTRNELYRILLTAYLAQGAVSKANELVDRFDEDLLSQPEIRLRLAILAFYESDFNESRTLITGLDASLLSAEDRAWRHMMEALLHMEEGAIDLANERFLAAKRTAPSRILREQFELVRLKFELEQGGLSAEEMNSLRNSVRSFAGQRSGFEAGRLLAIALYQSGQSAEAINFLSLQIQQPGIGESGLKPVYLLLIGLMSGEESFQGKLALEQLVREGGNRDLQGIALTLLAQSSLSGEGQEAFLDQLSEWLQTASTRPLRDRLLLYRAFILSDLTQFGPAEADALALLNEFPGSPLVVPSLRLLAYISWSRVPAQYRTAADYLSQLRERLPDGRERSRVTRLMGDCFFLNRDYQSASEAYGSVLRSSDSIDRESTVFQQVMSEVLGGQLEEAEIILNRELEAVGLSEMLWRAEWNFLEALKRNDQAEQAINRLSMLFEREEFSGLEPELRFRFNWINYRLLLEVDQWSEINPQIQSIISEVETIDSLSESAKRLLLSNFLLLSGEAYYRQGESESARQVFQQLRERYADSGPAVLSYLVEAREASAEDGIANAQQSLIALADNFPKTEYAPIALWEAAVNAEQRGLNRHLQEAITILERLVNDYPGHRLVFFARLKQGDLSRRLNDFSTALLIYDRLLNQFPSHPERYRAELSKADCLFAQGNQIENRFEDASVIYERLLLIPETPFHVRLEAGYKLSQTYLQQNLIENRRSTLWLIYDRFLNDERLKDFRSIEILQSRYWASRILIELGEIFARNGEIPQAIQFYQMIIDNNLPGTNLARGEITRLSPSTTLAQ